LTLDLHMLFLRRLVTITQKSKVTSSSLQQSRKMSSRAAGNLPLMGDGLQKVDSSDRQPDGTKVAEVMNAGSSNTSGISDLSTLLATMRPLIVPGEFVFISQPSGKYGDGAQLDPIAAFAEKEGLTLVVPKHRADEDDVKYDGVFRMITLQVHSSLDAVGLTAAVASALTKHNISANVIAAFYHDHIFVPSSRADDAITVLSELN
jgi:hypothetical protein